MSSDRSLAEKLAQWDQLAVIVLVVIVSQLGAMLWLDTHRPDARAPSNASATAAAP